MDFLNRNDELTSLEEHWQSPGGRFFVLWGRRRVGKTELLTHFATGKRHLYFEATQTNELNQLRSLSSELAATSDNEIFLQQPLTSWESALTAISQFVGNKRTLVVLDEFQWLAAQQRELGSLINRWWRKTGRHLPILFVISGSEVSFFRNEVLAGAMYGRRDGQFQIQPFDYRSAALFHPNYSAEDKVRTYAICGGMPYYLKYFSDEHSLRTNILNNILYRNGILHEEADLLLRQELGDPQKYFSVLEVIARGATQNNAIAQQTGLDKSNVTQTIAVLERMQLVTKKHPITAGPRSKKTIHIINDGFLNFYFRFVEPYRSRIRTREDADRHFRHTVAPQLDHFVSLPTWEQICQDYIRRAEDAKDVGSWWGKVPSRSDTKRTEDAEIDAVAINTAGDVIAIGSCKWTNAPVDIREEAMLARLEKYIPKSDNVQRHYFFSRSGFDTRLRKLAEKEPERFRLVGVNDMYL